MLNLKNTTLLFVETRAHKITKRVIEDCISKCNFGEILIFTDKPELIPVPGARYIDVPDFPNKREAGKFYYCTAMEEVTTDFALLLEWDAGIFNENKWLSDFFNYDYIGAPWMVRPGDTQDVGNGGFTLMSRKLGQRLCFDRRQHPVYTDMDVSRAARTRLEPQGFKWPHRTLASCFSWELGPRNPEHFGFHGNFTWPTTLPRAEIIERAALLTETPYLRSKIAPLIKAAPWVLAELPKDALDRYNIDAAPAFNPRIGTVFTPHQRMNMQTLIQQRRNIATAQDRAMQTKGLKA